MKVTVINTFAYPSQLIQAAMANDAIASSIVKEEVEDKEMKHLFVKQILVDKLTAFENAIFEEDVRIITTDLVN